MSTRPLIINWGEAASLTYTIRDFSGQLLSTGTPGLDPNADFVYLVYVEDTLSGRITWTDGSDTEEEVFYALNNVEGSPINLPPPVTFNGITPYQSVQQIDFYMLTHPYSSPWDDLTSNEKLKWSCEATRIINTLNYRGYKTDDSQSNEFPRNGETIVPNDILSAHSEISLELVAGGRPQEFDGVTSERFASVGASYDPKLVPVWRKLGIPSQRAWAYLYPYLQIEGGITLRRVS
jgi:hypothetical protein